MLMLKTLYRPVGLLVSILGGLMAGALFKQLWKRVAHEDDAPKPGQSERSWREIVPAAAIEGAVFGAVKAAVDRGSLKTFEKATGVWAGD
jgi:hypothetical protein